ncbi:hypothetical protein D0Z70_06660, partial [Sphingobium terrigena]
LSENRDDHPRCWLAATALYRKRAASQQRYRHNLHHVRGRDLDRKVAESRFRSRSEAICEGMRLLELQEIQIKENVKQLF